MKVRKGDLVKVIVGKDAGKISKVLRVYSKGLKVLVENVNVVRKHQKGDGRLVKSGIVEVMKPLDISNVKLVCPNCSEATKVGYKVVDGKKVRICKKCGSVIDTRLVKSKGETKSGKVKSKSVERSGVKKRKTRTKKD